MQTAYRSDLAYIHDAGYGYIAQNAAPFLLEELRRTGIERGTVVDLGCGSGISLRLLCDAGFSGIGFDLSASMIEIARERVPEAEFHVGSFLTAELPPCAAVTAIGEIFNYAFDPANDDDARADVFDRIYAALDPGGFLVFDMASPARAPSVSPQRTFTEGTDWTVLVEASVDDGRRVLTRKITSFRKEGDLYRRDFEEHQLQLVDPNDVLTSLRRVGFSARALDRYGSYPLPQGLVGFSARKRFFSG